MRFDRPFLLLLTLLPVLAPADEAAIDAHSDLLYRQAVPLLEQADQQSSALATEKEPSERELISQVQALGHTLEPAVALLEKAAVLNHPVAQYRLALHYITYLPVADIPKAACPLLESSIRQGFAPAALGVVSWCPGFAASTEFAQAMERVPSFASQYAAYYPQPAVRLECRREQPRGLAMQWGRQRDFQAELYRLLAARDITQRTEYLLKAVDINGCVVAQRRLTQAN